MMMVMVTDDDGLDWSELARSVSFCLWTASRRLLMLMVTMINMMIMMMIK